MIIQEYTRTLAPSQTAPVKLSNTQEYWQRGYEQEFGKVIICEYENSEINDICAPRMLRLLNIMIRIS